MKTTKMFSSSRSTAVVVLIVSILSVSNVTVQSPLDAPTSLYGPLDKVVVLNATNIKQNIYRSSKAWVVEFFSSWCGHCIHFAPKWKAFAENVSGWSGAVSIAGIDCADENNIQTCREYEIMGYPTLLLFPPKAEPSITNQEGKDVLNRGSIFKRSELIGDMRRQLVQNLTDLLPNLFAISEAIKTGDVNQFWTDSKSKIDPKTSFVLLIYEGQNSTLGTEVALQLRQFSDILIYRFHKRNPMYSSLALDGWPAIGYAKQRSNSGPIQLQRNTNLVDSLTKEVMHLAGVSKSSASLPSNIENPNDHPPDNDQNPVKENTNKISILQPPKEDKVSMEDLIHAIRNSLSNEVGLVKKIEGSKLIALKNYVKVLTLLFPADRREIKLFFFKLEAWLYPLNQIHNNEYLDKLTELELELHPWDIDLVNWEECKGSIPGRRGYTCGLWRLFHTLTVIGLEKEDDIKVIDAIHGYVKEFFGCTECSQHFTKMVTNDSALFIKPIREQVLWLWNAHNKVNTRIKGTASEDPEYPKQIYPSISQCPTCYIAPGRYVEKEVEKYLISVYSNPQRIVNNLETPRALHVRQVDDKRQDENESRNSAASSLFSLADIGIFMIVYIIVVILLILGYIHFRMVSLRRFDSFFLCRSRRLCSSMV